MGKWISLDDFKQMKPAGKSISELFAPAVEKPPVPQPRQPAKQTKFVVDPSRRDTGPHPRVRDRVYSTLLGKKLNIRDRPEMNVKDEKGKSPFHYPRRTPRAMDSDEIPHGFERRQQDETGSWLGDILNADDDSDRTKPLHELIEKGRGR